MNKKNNVALYLCIALFGIVGVYLTFFVGGSNKYDSQTKAYDINPNERYDPEDGTIYHPIYYFKVDEKEYECKSKTGSSTYPKPRKNTVYYNSSDPTQCKTEYEQSTGKFGGIICLIVTALMIYFFVIKKPKTNIVVNNGEENNQEQNIDIDSQKRLELETAEKMNELANKVGIIYKRVIIGIIIFILAILTLFDTAIFSQTLKAKNYIETTATYVETKTSDDDSIFDDCTYAFTDKNGMNQEITVSITKDSTPENEITIKYNENNPQDYYSDGATLDSKGMIFYFGKIVALILLVILFFNKNLLSKINLRASV